MKRILFLIERLRYLSSASGAKAEKNAKESLELRAKALEAEAELMVEVSKLVVSFDEVFVDLEKAMDILGDLLEGINSEPAEGSGLSGAEWEKRIKSAVDYLECRE